MVLVLVWGSEASGLWVPGTKMKTRSTLEQEP